MRKTLITILFALFFIHGKTQQILYQDMVKGGITCGGFSAGMSIGSGQFEIYIPPGSSVKRAFLIRDRFNFPDYGDVILNGTNYHFDSTNQVTDEYLINWDITGVNTYYGAIHVIDMTNEINPNVLLYNVELETSPEPCGAECLFGPIYLVVVYENDTMPETACTVMLNTQPLFINSVNYNLQNLNPINSSYPVGLSVFGDRMNLLDPYEDGSYVFVNNSLIGLVGGPNNNDNTTVGCRGDFYYQENSLTGLMDDTANFTMFAYDALADISPLIANNSTSCDVRFIWQDSTHGGNRFNQYNALVLSYTSNCPDFEVELNTTDTLICLGEPFQLEVSGGSIYDWSPAEGLSCTDCPNPVVEIDRDMSYSVTVSNSDSCSKTIPVFIRLSEPPIISSLEVSSDTCGFEVGKLEVLANGYAPLSYDLNGNDQVSNQFDSLIGGDYLLHVSDQYGCTDDTLINIPSEQIVRSGFSADPTIGEVPLDVTFTDESSNGNNWIWYINNDTIFGQNPDYHFNTVDTFNITQIVYYNNLECSDTSYTSIMVYKPITIEIPNVFTPNEDNINDVFSIKIEGAEIVRWKIFNRWGQMVSFGETEVSTDNQNINLWKGEGQNYDLPSSDGVYYYKISVRSPAFVTSEHVGQFTLIRGQ